MPSLTGSSDQSSGARPVQVSIAASGNIALAGAFGRVAAVFSGVLAFASVALAIYGTVHDWHPLPHWDMWTGYVGFWYRVQGGDISAWWAQHNEHRIILARLFFWTDFRFFRGAGKFLIISNVSALTSIAMVQIFALRLRLREGRVQEASSGLALIGSALLCLLFAWMQQSNLTWGFQIQFILASLLPLSCFLALGAAANARTSVPARTRRWQVVAWALAALSVGTMASGLCVPYLAVGLLVVLRSRRSVVAAFFVLAAAATVLYLTGFNQNADGGGGPLVPLVHQPGQVLVYFLSYLGGPLEHAHGSHAAGVVSGVAYVGAFVLCALRSRGRTHAGVALAMVTFVAYVLAGGLMTAAGRLHLGLEYAVSSRYQTPVLVGWSCLLIIVAPRIQRATGGRGVASASALLAVPVLLLPQQLLALADVSGVLGSKDVATLAIALDVPDAEAMRVTFPGAQTPLRLGRRLRADGLTVLEASPIGVDLSGSEERHLPLSRARPVARRFSSPSRFEEVSSGASLGTIASAPAQTAGLARPSHHRWQGGDCRVCRGRPLRARSRPSSDRTVHYRTGGLRTRTSTAPPAPRCLRPPMVREALGVC